MSTSFKINSFGTPNSTTPSTIYSNKNSTNNIQVFSFTVTTNDTGIITIGRLPNNCKSIITFYLEIDKEFSPISGTLSAGILEFNVSFLNLILPRLSGEYIDGVISSTQVAIDGKVDVFIGVDTTDTKTVKYTAYVVCLCD